MQTTLHPLFVILVGIIVQIAFAILVYGVLMGLNYVFADCEQAEAEDAEKGEKPRRFWFYFVHKP